eukprot:CAMPEP_0118656404 /NCGR_PEP_ID=MMETSP0785-20121206/13472_1 /TAXON_ID=91992 /ORGANISM="Bolidomonas pacifica, Strain CCMP 1866" /LENGTH=669 /DNA_ID=CAMNT_0006549263 /DNA_START=99 /DNA_END=2108 /DNA_ORIENTATION=+
MVRQQYPGNTLAYISKLCMLLYFALPLASGTSMNTKYIGRTIIYGVVASSGLSRSLDSPLPYIISSQPTNETVLTKGKENLIVWKNNYTTLDTEHGTGAKVKILLRRDGTLPRDECEPGSDTKVTYIIAESTPADDGEFKWVVPISLDIGDDYYISIEDIEDRETIYGYAPNLNMGFMRISKPPSSLWWLFGVFLSIIASILSNLGVNLQKLSMMNESRDKAASKKRLYFTQPMWQFGLVTLIIGSVGDFIALGFAPQSLMTPVGGFTLVCNAVFAHYFLSETLTYRDKIGTLNIIVGIIILAVFGAKTNTSYTVDELLHMYQQPAFIAYVVVLAIICVGLYVLYVKCKNIEKEFGKGHEKYQKLKKFHPLTCSALSGCLGAQSILCAKSTAEMIKESFAGNMQFNKISAWFIVFGMIFFIFSQIHWLARGLESFDAVYIVPVFQCFFISVAVIGGAVYFREFDDMPDRQRLGFFFGLAVTLSGVYLLSQRDMSKLKPRARFRARAFVLIFIHRTRKIIAEKKAQDERDNAEFEENVRLSPSASIEVLNPATTRVPSIDGITLPGQIDSASPPSKEVSPRVEERKAKDDQAKKDEVEIVRKQLRTRRNSAANVLPIMAVGGAIDDKKKEVEGKIKDGVKHAAIKIGEGGKKVANNIRGGGKTQVQTKAT